MRRSAQTRRNFDDHDLAALGRALGFAVVVLDCKGRICAVRGAAEEVLGRPLSRVVGRRLASFIAKGDRFALAECLERGLREFVPLKLAAPRSAPRWIEIRASRPEADQPVHSVLIAARDVTERRADEQALLAAIERQRAGWSERLCEDLSQRVAGISYTLHALAGTLSSDSGDVEVLRETVAELGAAAKDMRSLAHEFDPVSDRSGGMKGAWLRLASRLGQAPRTAVPVAVDAAGWQRTRLGAAFALCWHEILEELVEEARSDPATSSVRVTLGREPGVLAATVDVVRGSRSRHGLTTGAPGISRSARERARLLGASLRREIRSGRISTVVTSPI